MQAMYGVLHERAASSRHVLYWLSLELLYILLTQVLRQLTALQNIISQSDLEAVKDPL